MAAEPQELKGPMDEQQTMAAPMCLRVDFKTEFVLRFPLCPGMTILHLPVSFSLALCRYGLLSFSNFSFENYYGVFF